MSASDNDSDVSEDGISLIIDSKGSKECNVSVENVYIICKVMSISMHVVFA